MPVTKPVFLAAFGLANHAQSSAGGASVQRDDYPGGVSITITMGLGRVVLEWNGGAVAWGGRSLDTPAPLMELLAHSPRQVQLRRLLEGFLGAAKLASLENPQGVVRLSGFSSVLIHHDSSSLLAPAGFVGAINIAAARLLDTKTGAEIAGQVLSAGVQIEVSYAPGLFEFKPLLASPSTMAPDAMGRLLADVRVATRYFSVQRAAEGIAVAGWFHGNLSVLLAHELIHAIHCYRDFPGYLARGLAPPSHPDWANMEEQFTITGVLDGLEVSVSECGLLKELGYRMRWGHIPRPELRGAVPADKLVPVYGRDWARRF